MTRTVKAVLIEARRLISDIENWTQRELAHDNDGKVVEPSEPGAYCWCADGAVRKVLDIGPFDADADAKPIYFRAREALEVVARKQFPLSTEFSCHYVAVNDGEVGIPDEIGNDESFRLAHENILKVFDAAIAEAA